MSEVWPPFIDPNLRITLSEAREEINAKQADSSRVFQG